MTTKRKRSKAVVQDHDDLLAVALEAFPGLLGRVDRNLRFLFASHGFERIFGVSPRDIVGR